MEIPLSVKRLNDRLGRSLGKNPHDEPLYKWVHSEDFWHWMMDHNGYKEVFTPVKGGPRVHVDGALIGKRPGRKYARKGVFAMEPTYTKRKMCPQFTDTWVMAKWQRPPLEGVWRTMYGSLVMWPRTGMYTIANAWCERGQLPCDGLTDRFIEIVSRYRAKTAADIRKEGEDADEYEDKEASRLRKDIIEDAMTAHLAIPGSRAGSVSFPMPRVDYAAPLKDSTPA